MHLSYVWFIAYLISSRLPFCTQTQSPVFPGTFNKYLIYTLLWSKQSCPQMDESGRSNSNSCILKLKGHGSAAPSIPGTCILNSYRLPSQTHSHPATYIFVCAYFMYLTLATQTRKIISSEVHCCSSGLFNQCYTLFLHSSVNLLKAWSQINNLEKGTLFWGWLIRKQETNIYLQKVNTIYKFEDFSTCKNSIVLYTEKLSLM